MIKQNLVNVIKKAHIIEVMCAFDIKCDVAF